MVCLLTLLLLGAGCGMLDAATTVRPTTGGKSGVATPPPATCQGYPDSMDLGPDDKYYFFSGAFFYTSQKTTHAASKPQLITDLFADVKYPVIAAFSTGPSKANGRMFIFDSAAPDKNVKQYRFNTTVTPLKAERIGSLQTFFPSGDTQLPKPLTAALGVTKPARAFFFGGASGKQQAVMYTYDTTGITFKLAGSTKLEKAFWTSTVRTAGSYYSPKSRRITMYAFNATSAVQISDNLDILSGPTAVTGKPAQWLPVVLSQACSVLDTAAVTAPTTTAVTAPSIARLEKVALTDSFITATNKGWPAEINCGSVPDAADMAPDENYYFFHGAYVYTTNRTTQRITQPELIKDVFGTVVYPVLAAFSTGPDNMRMVLIDSAPPKSNVKWYHFDTASIHPRRPHATGSLDTFFLKPTGPLEPGRITIQDLKPIRAAVGHYTKERIQIYGDLPNRPGVVVEYSFNPGPTFDWMSGYDSDGADGLPGAALPTEPWAKNVQAMLEIHSPDDGEVIIFGSDSTITQLHAGRPADGPSPVASCASWFHPTLSAICCEHFITTLAPETTTHGVVTTTGHSVSSTPHGGSTGSSSSSSTTPQRSSTTTSPGAPFIPILEDLTTPHGGTTTPVSGGSTTPHGGTSTPVSGGSTTPHGGTTTPVSGGSTTPHGGVSTTVSGGSTTPHGGTTTPVSGGSTTPHGGTSTPVSGGSTTPHGGVSTTVSGGSTTPHGGTTTPVSGGSTTPHGGTTTPVSGGSTTPHGGTSTPVSGGSTTPHGGTTTPVSGGSTTPHGGTSTPVSGGSTTPHGGTTTPVSGGSTTPHGGVSTTVSGGSTTPHGGTTTPVSGGSTTPHGGVSTTVSGGSTTPHGGTTTPVSGGSTTPHGGTSTPVSGGSTTPHGGVSTTVSGGSTTPHGGTTTPVSGGSTTPHGGVSTTVSGGSTTPHGGTSTPVSGGSTTPHGGTSTPVSGGSTTPHGGVSTSVSGGSTTPHGSGTTQGSGVFTTTSAAVYTTTTKPWPNWMTCGATIDSIDLASDDNYYVFVDSHLYTVHKITKLLTPYDQINDVFAAVEYPIIAAFSTPAPTARMFIIDSSAAASNVKVFEVGDGKAYPHQPRSVGSLDTYFKVPPLEPGLATVQNLSPLRSAVWQSSKVQFRGTMANQPGLRVQYSYDPVTQTFDWLSGFNGNDPFWPPGLEPDVPEEVQPWMHVVQAMTESGSADDGSVIAFGSDGSVTRILANGKTVPDQQQVPALKCPSWMAPVIVATCCEQSLTTPSSTGPTTPDGRTTSISPGGLTTPHGGTTPIGPGGLTTPHGSETTFVPGSLTTPYVPPDTTPYLDPYTSTTAYPIMSGSTTDPSGRTTIGVGGQTTPGSSGSTTRGPGDETTPDPSDVIFPPPSCCSSGCCKPPVVVEGWRAVASGTSASETINVEGIAKTGRLCLRKCQVVNSQCRLVSFDFNTQKCSGFTRKAVPRFQRDLNAVVLADTDKVIYSSSPGCHGSGLQEGESDKIEVKHSGHADVCKSLCVVHPRCVHAEFVDSNCDLNICQVSQSMAG